MLVFSIVHPVPKSVNFYIVLERSCFYNFVLLGDLIDFYRSHSPQYCKLTDIMCTFSLMQAFGEATHTTHAL